MPQTNQLAHRNVTSTALGYRSNMSPTDTTPCYVSGSGDMITSINGYTERRPGFSTNVEPTPTIFTNMQRYFSWDRWDGTFIIMACDVVAMQAKVYKFVVGQDSSFVLIFTDTVSTLFDFGVSNNTVYFSNGNSAKAWDPINGIRNWGIAIGSTNAGTNTTAAGTDVAVSGAVAWTNPNNVTSAVSYATVTLTAASKEPGIAQGTKSSDYIQATQFGFGLGTTNKVLGIQISITAFIDGITGTGSSLFNTINLMKNGVTVGTAKTFTQITGGSPTVYTFGGAADLWGTTWSANDINLTNWGVQIQTIETTLFSSTATFHINNVQATIFSIGGPAVSVSGSAGAVTANIGWQYVFCYGNSNTGHISSPTPVSASTGAFGGIISTTTVAAGGSGYVNNDTGIISAGNFNATYTVNSVTAGAVTTYTISTAGTGYIVANNIPTARGGTQPGVGTGFTINITAVTGKLNVQVSLTASTDPQVNQIRVFRTTDSVPLGATGGTFFELPTSPYANTTTNILDTATDTTLNIASLAPFPGFNDPPTPGQQVAFYSGRFWLFKNNKVVFSGLEEIISGVPEESFPSGPAGNFWNFDQTVQGLAVAGSTLAQTLGVWCGGRLYGITGNSLDTFRRFLVSNRRGCRNLNTITSLGGMVAWFDSSSTVWVTDGNSLQEISVDIRPDLAGLSPIGANFTFHVSGRFHWLVCAFPTKIFIYDLDLGQWMPPWNFTNKAMYSGETSAGNYQLLASTGTAALILNQAGTAGSFNDNGVTYQPVLKTANHAVVPDFGKRFSYASLGLYDQPSKTGVGWYVQSDTNSLNTFSDIQILVDDDPLNSGSVYNTIVANKLTPAVAWNRNQGTFLVQNIYSMNGPMGRWYAIKFILANADQIDKMYSYFLAYEERK